MSGILDLGRVPLPIQQFTAEELQTKLQVVLQTWPLYRVLHYGGANEVTFLPQQLTLLCDYCERDTLWQRQNNYGDKSGFTQNEYKCRNCGNRTTRYYFYWYTKEDSNLFLKVGQYPELEERVSKDLEKALRAEDLKIYKNALRLRNFNLGIGAVSYMRRVVENRMNDMLEILHDAARVHNAPEEVLKRHEEVKKDKRFSVKVDYAGDLLPANLRPPGHPNPMAILHELASDGLHNKSDEEGVDIFDACRETFEYVFGRMRIETEQAAGFVKSMAKLAEKRTKASKP